MLVRLALSVSGSIARLVAASQADDSFPCVVYAEEGFYYIEQGYISVSATVTGLSANTNYEVQLFAARDSSSPAKTISFGGTASATGS